MRGRTSAKLLANWIASARVTGPRFSLFRVPPQRFGGHELHLISLEESPEEFTVHWAWVPPEGTGNPLAPQFWDVSARAHGRDYACKGLRISGGADEPARGEWTFKPALPGRWTELVVTVAPGDTTGPVPVARLDEFFDRHTEAAPVSFTIPRPSG